MVSHPVDGAAALSAFLAANATLLLLDSYDVASSEAGSAARLDLRRPPFGLPMPLQKFVDQGTDEQLLLYHTADLKGLSSGRTSTS